MFSICRIVNKLHHANWKTVGLVHKATPRNISSSKVNTIEVNLAKDVGNQGNFNRPGSMFARVETQITDRGRKRVGWWLVGLSGLVAATVSLGGITRLTKSGLSMVTWHPFYEFPPTSQVGWEEEFERYKKYPEYIYSNSGITLDEFKKIWYMEYAHRSFGRIVGLAFFVPVTYFAFKGYLKGNTKYVMAGIGTLIISQGLIGWLMVQSGMYNKPVDNQEPRVSHLRLAFHLGTAFTIFSVSALTALHHLIPPEKLTKTANLLKLKRFAFGITGAVFTTALSGALVAGLGAGLTYNSWPMMADRWIPTDLFAKSPTWKNFLHNSTTVQFDHRWLAQTTFLLIAGTWLYSLRLPLPPRLRAAAHLVMAAACFQVGLGISTLLLYVPKHLAATHQSGSLALLASCLWLSHELKLVKRIPI